MSRFSPVLAALLLLPLTACNELFGSDEVTVTVTDTANVRDAATTEGSNVIAELEAGTELSGEWVETGSGPKDKWLEFDFKGKKAFVWVGNLQVNSDVATAPSPQNAKLDVDALKKQYAVEAANCDKLHASEEGDGPACDRVREISGKLYDLGWCHNQKNGTWRSCDEAYQEFVDSVEAEATPPQFKINSWTEYDSFMDSEDFKFSVQSLEENIIVKDININRGNCGIIYTLPHLPAKLNYGASIEGEVVPYPKCSIVSVEISTDRGNVTYTMR